MFFEDIISQLQAFWASQGCLVLQPVDIPVGAGTLAPFTALRCLRNTPWSACYVQGCRRPNDGRYGANPNRLAHYYQFQVIIQPALADVQKIFLQSLQALTLNPKENDIRFLEDDWENPSIGAAGLGWEVWLNGLEITQITFFQQLASMPCDLPAIEITYGLERIAMSLQKVNSIFEIAWNKNTTYGDIFLQQEKDMSSVSFDLSDTQFLKTCFEQHLKDAQRFTNANAHTSAYEQCLYASHTFNILHAQGALSVTERENSISSIRSLTRTVGLAYKKSFDHE